MDSSKAYLHAYDIVLRLQGTHQVPAKEIPGSSWLRVLDDLISDHDGVLGRTHDVFSPIADLMSGNDRSKVQIQVPRAMTVFESGLAPVTRVLPVRIESYGCGERLSEEPNALWSHNTNKYLLLRAPEKASQRTTWALWTVSYNLSIIARRDRTDIKRSAWSSKVCLLDRDLVAKELDADPHLGYTLLSLIHRGLRGVHEEMRKVAALDAEVEQMMRRIELN